MGVVLGSSPEQPGSWVPPGVPDSGEKENQSKSRKDKKEEMQLRVEAVGCCP